MKTTSNVQKTENRNFKTSIMKTLVVLTSVVLFSLMAHANENTNNQAINEGNDHLLAVNTLANFAPVSEMNSTDAFMEISTEESLEVENWMTNDNFFVAPMPVTETEETLEVEQWMITDQNFIETTIVEESENTLEVEDWMLNETTWGN